MVFGKWQENFKGLRKLPKTPIKVFTDGWTPHKCFESTGERSYKKFECPNDQNIVYNKVCVWEHKCVPSV
jgi:hypothetical protein